MSDSVEKSELILELLRVWLAMPNLEFYALLELALMYLDSHMSPAEQQRALQALVSLARSHDGPISESDLLASTKPANGLPASALAARLMGAIPAIAKGFVLDSQKLNTEIENWTKQTENLQKAFNQYGSSNSQMQPQCQELEKHLQSDQQTIQQFQQELQSSNS